MKLNQIIIIYKVFVIKKKEIKEKEWISSKIALQNFTIKISFYSFIQVCCMNE